MVGELLAVISQYLGNLDRASFVQCLDKAKACALAAVLSLLICTNKGLSPLGARAKPLALHTGSMPSIPVSEVELLPPDTALIDARDETSYLAGHIPHARHLAASQCRPTLSSLPARRTAGWRTAANSHLACQMLIFCQCPHPHSYRLPLALFFYCKSISAPLPSCYPLL
jgi:hypothetical protein